MATTDMTFKRVYVSNLDDRVTVQDIQKLFGLDLSDYLQKNTFVDLKVGENRAEVILPASNVDDIVKLTGMIMYDQTINVAATQGETETANETTTSEDTASDIRSMFLDTRRPEWAKNPITELEVCDAIHKAMPDDPTKTVKALWGTMLGCFRIESKSYAPYLSLKLIVREVELPLAPIRFNKTTNREYRDNRRTTFHSTFDPTGVKVTINDAWDKDNDSIPHESFDNAFLNKGIQIIKQTQPMLCRGSRSVMSTHRYLVAKVVNDDGSRRDLGNQIEVEGKVFRLHYYGITRWCSLCSAKHGRECPKKIRFEYLKELRQGRTEKRKIHSDSTLRYTNQLALTTDVACMSGGGLGQLCNWVKYDDKHAEVILAAGSNEVHSTDPLNEFVFTVKKAQEKIRHTAEAHEKVMVVLPPIPQDTPELKAKGEYLREALEAIEVVQTVQLESVPLEDDVHPSLEGTAIVLDQIDAALNKEIILEGCRDDAVLPRKYCQVQAVYKVGCRGCDNMEYTARLCAACREEAKQMDTKSLEDRIEQIRTILYPENNKSNKRGHEGSDTDDDGDKTQAKKVTV